MDFAVFLILILCLSRARSAPYETESIEANYLHSATKSVVRVDAFQSEEEKRRARKQLYFEEAEMISERAGYPELKWTDPHEQDQESTLLCAEGECNHDQNLADPTPDFPPIKTLPDCPSCVYVIQNGKMFGPFSMPGLIDHFGKQAQWVDIIIDGKWIRGHLFGPFKPSGTPFFSKALP